MKKTPRPCIISRISKSWRSRGQFSAFISEVTIYVFFMPDFETRQQGVDNREWQGGLQACSRVERLTPKWCRSFQLSGFPGIDANMRACGPALSRRSRYHRKHPSVRHKDRNELPFPSAVSKLNPCCSASRTRFLVSCACLSRMRA